MELTHLPLIIITGPTASGKTRLAVQVAARLNGEIISADSRQVYRGMDIGTGKDLSDYEIDGQRIPYHLIDICDAGEEYNLYQYQKDFSEAHREIISRGKTPVLCGGTGLYIEGVLKDFQQTAVPVNENLRAELEKKDKNELERYLRMFNDQKLNFDVSTKKRLIRAIEISQYLEKNDIPERSPGELDYIIFCIDPGRGEVLKRIRDRLIYRLSHGMIEEVERLLRGGVSAEKLKYYGLEYKFITQYLEREFPYEEMVERLNVAIRQYAKRQMTWFRRMERNGFKIHWIRSVNNVENQVEMVLSLMADE